MDNATKTQHLKGGIKHDIGLEHTITLKEILEDLDPSLQLMLLTEMYASNN